MRYLVKRNEYIFYGPSCYFVESMETPLPVKEIKVHHLLSFDSKKQIGVGEMISIHGDFWVVDEKVWVQLRNEKHIELYVKPYDGGVPWNQMIYWPSCDRREIWKGWNYT